jgi:tetratricopeptide (TPR) repeat protein
VPDFVSSWLESNRAGSILLIAAVIAVVGAGIVLWQIFGSGPRGGRRLQRAQRRLERGDWQESLAVIEQLEGQGSLSSNWAKRLANVKAQCHQAAADAALAVNSFEVALDHALQATRLGHGKDLEARGRIIEAMLADLRRSFATSSDNKPTYQLIERILKLQSPCLEASFWRGMCQVRDGDLERSMASLEAARTGETTASPSDKAQVADQSRVTAFIDPPLYLGALFLRQGQAKEALRYLTEANRIDGNCPFVVCQLGAAMIQSGGDPQLAVRALQRALGPRGFQLWVKNPQRAWVEGFPDKRSFVRKLAAKNAYRCPLWGPGLQGILRQGNTALGQGFYRLGQYQEAADIFGKLMQESAPSLPVVRGLGLTLARLGQYDPAFKHLRIAHEMEETKDRITAGYLALCGTRGTPSRPEDKSKNISWAIGLVSKFTAPGDIEWAGLVSAIFAEARAEEVAVDADDQVYLCEHLASVYATDALAADAYHHLIATHPEVVHSEYAWLFCRASQLHGSGGSQAPALFARTFAEETAARPFFEQRQWDFSALELTYLERAAAAEPGHFPSALGADYAKRGECLLLERSAEQEQAGEMDAALATATVFLKLAPANPRAHDRLAYLHYRKGEKQQAADLLAGWHRLESHDPQPLIRLAIIAQELGDATRSLDSIRQALELTTGRTHADIAFLGARLALRQTEAPLVNGDEVAGESTEERAHGDRAAAIALLQDCLHHEPQHGQALWLMAALRHLTGDRRALTDQAARMDIPHIDDPRFHFLAAVCQLSAGNYGGVLEACERSSSSSVPLDVPENAALSPLDGEVAPRDANKVSLAVESAYLAGWAHLMHGNPNAAPDSFRVPATTPVSPSASHAQALLGKICFENGDYDEAVRWLQALDAKKRAGWRLAESLAGAVFLSALEAFQAGAYTQAGERLREAGRAGLRDRRLGLLLSLCYVKAGQQALYANNENDVTGMAVV